MSWFNKIKQKMNEKKSKKQYGADSETVDFFLERAEYDEDEPSDYEIKPEFMVFKDYYTYYNLMNRWVYPAWSKQDLLIQSIFVNEKLYNFKNKHYIPLIYDEYEAVLDDEQINAMKQNGMVLERDYDKKVVNLNIELFKDTR